MIKDDKNSLFPSLRGMLSGIGSTQSSMPAGATELLQMKRRELRLVNLRVTANLGGAEWERANTIGHGTWYSGEDGHIYQYNVWINPNQTGALAHELFVNRAVPSMKLREFVSRGSPDHRVNLTHLTRKWGTATSTGLISHLMALMAFEEEYEKGAHAEGLEINLWFAIPFTTDGVKERVSLLNKLIDDATLKKLPGLFGFGLMDEDDYRQILTDRYAGSAVLERVKSIYSSRMLPWVTQAQLVSGSGRESTIELLEARFREEDCPTTPDGAWLRYLNDLLKEPAVPVTLPQPEGVPVQPEAAEPPPAAPQATETPKAAPSKGRLRATLGHKPVWEGVDPELILVRLLEGEVPIQAVDGDLRVWGELRDALVQEQGKAGTRTRTTERNAGAKDVSVRALVRGELAFMTPEHFRVRVQTRIYPYRHELAVRVGRKFPYILANIHTLLPGDWGSVPGVVAGEHRPDGDRLCAVNVIWPEEKATDLDDPTKPYTYKYGGKVHTLPYVPKGMVAFPAGWLKRGWGLLAGLYGSPLDPTLLDWWGDSSPPEGWLGHFLEWMPPDLQHDDVPAYPRAQVDALISRLR